MRSLKIAMAMVAVAVAGCSSDPTSDALAAIKADKPEAIGKACETFRIMADRDDVRAQLAAMPTDERETFVDEFRDVLEGTVEDVETWDFGEIQDLMVAMYDECP